MSEYESWREQHDLSRVRSDVKVAREYMLNRGYGQDLGLIGFCFGGGRLMEELARGKGGLNPKAAVAFYPTSTLYIALTNMFQWHKPILSLTNWHTRSCVH